MRMNVKSKEYVVSSLFQVDSLFKDFLELHHDHTRSHDCDSLQYVVRGKLIRATVTFSQNKRNRVLGLNHLLKDTRSLNVWFKLAHGAL